MHLQIGKQLMIVHNDQLSYSNHQSIDLTLPTGFKIWLAHNCQMEEDHPNIKIGTALLLYNACTFFKMMKICVTNNNKLNIHLRGMATLNKHDQLVNFLLKKTFQLCEQYKGNYIPEIKTLQEKLKLHCVIQNIKNLTTLEKSS